MSTERQQSAIAEVRDQLSLDYSDGERLNVVSSNIGLTRPPFGFSDDVWRAITKVLALQHKQIRQKFHDVLTLVLGPRITQTATLASSVASGVRQLTLNSSSHLPQTGTAILDEGLATEEVVDYSFIDYQTNTMYLDDATTFAHTSFSEFDSDEPLIFDAAAGATTLYLPRSIFMPTTFPGTIVLGRGTEFEEVVAITANDTDAGTITVTALTYDHQGLKPSVVQSDLLQDYIETSEFLSLSSTADFPDSGYVRLGASSNTIATTGGTTTTVAFSVGSLTEDRHVGSILVFTGNVTPALAGVEAEVVANTGTGATFRTALGTAPAVGDTFYVRPMARYIRNVYADNALQLARDIPDLALATSTEVELLEVNSTAVLGSVNVSGGGWDVIQTSPRLVEIYIPDSLQDINTLLTTSYLHPEILAASTTVTANASISDTTLELASTLDLPPAGGLLIDSGGGNEELVGYSLIELSSLYVSAGSTTTTLNVADSIFSTAVVGQVVKVQDLGLGISFSRTITSSTGTSVSFTDPVPNEILSQLRDTHTYLSYFDSENVSIPTGLVSAHLIAETAEYFEVAHSGAPALADGNMWTTDGLWMGPYVYNILSNAPTPTVYSSTLSEHLAGPTYVEVDQLSNNTALEVENAISMPLGAVSPFQCIVGRDTGNRETITVQDVNLKRRTSTTVAAGSLVGALEIQVAALSGGGTADTFPNVRGYRVMIGRGTANEEIVYVASTDTGPDRLVLSQAATSIHGIGETVELLSDVLSVDPLDDNHMGSVKFVNKLVSEFPLGLTSTIVSSTDANSSNIIVTNAANFPISGKLKVLQDEYTYSRTGNTITLINPAFSLRAYSAATPVSVLRAQAVAERVEPLYSEIPVTSTLGLPVTGDVIINFGSNVLPVTGVGTAEIAGTTTITLADSSDFPVSYPYEIVIRPGHRNEERHLVTLNDGATELTLNGGSYGIVNALAAGDVIQLVAGPSQQLTYTSTTASTLRFSTPVVLNYSVPSGTPVIYTAGISQPRADGYDFALRMPVDITFRLQFLLDLIRAAGVKVEIINKR